MEESSLVDKIILYFLLLIYLLKKLSYITSYK